MSYVSFKGCGHDLRIANATSTERVPSSAAFPVEVVDVVFKVDDVVEIVVVDDVVVKVDIVQVDDVVVVVAVVVVTWSIGGPRQVHSRVCPDLDLSLAPKLSRLRKSWSRELQREREQQMKNESFFAGGKQMISRSCSLFLFRFLFLSLSQSL